MWGEFKRVDLGHIKFGDVVYIQLVDSLNVISFYIEVCYAFTSLTSLGLLQLWSIAAQGFIVTLHQGC